MATKIRISLDGTVLTATLNESMAAQEFAAMLPLTLTLEDYNRTEKISDLPRMLSREGAPAGFDPSAGVIAYYAPWGNLAVFYRDFRYSDDLIPLGRIDSGVEALSRPEPVTARIERLTD
ncbi:cyclophilin-like fold protein [Phenylobacterium sp. LjRoot225]|uniref:cyclophilin-like fold protein n=1 Tax=Phenylobacterium sp. LjRoot225 TaxID=3342285 RepID=UPI003ECDF397